MKKIKTLIMVCSATLLILWGIRCSSGEKAMEEEAAAVPEETEAAELQVENIELPLPNSEEKLAVNAHIPATWIRNPEFGTVVFEPQNRDDYFYPPIIQFETSCWGSCDPAAIPGNIENKIQGIKDALARPNINTGDPELDAVRANVEILKEEKFQEDGWILSAVVTYPQHLSSAQYIPKVVVHTFRHHSGDGFFVQTTARAHLKQKDEFLPILLKACLETDY